MKIVHQIRLKELGFSETQTVSIILVTENGNVLFQCYMLEPPWENNETSISAIYSGSFILRKMSAGENGSRFKYAHFQVMNVPFRTYVKWHIGNDVDDTEGCGLPGMKLADFDNDGIPEVASSTIALQRLFDLLDEETLLIISES